MHLRDSIALLKVLVAGGSGISERVLDELAEQDTPVLWFRLDEDLSGAGTGYNPYRDDQGKFTTPNRASSVGGKRSWRVGFDSIPYEKQIDHFKETESKHRTASLKLKTRLDSINKRAKVASPSRQAELKAKFDDLTVQRETHQKAAELARNSRLAFKAGLDAARTAHTAQRKDVSAQRKAILAQRKAAEREGVMRIGRTRIGGSEDSTSALDAEPVPQWADTPEYRFGIGVDRIAPEPESPRTLSPLEMLSKMKPNYVHKPAVKPVDPDEDKRKRQKEIDYADRERERQKKAKLDRATLPSVASAVSLKIPSSTPGVSKRELEKIFRSLGMSTPD
jgi:hypothetical protein